MLRVTGTNIVQGVINANPKSTKANDLRTWLGIVRGAGWKGPKDGWASFPNATTADNVNWNFPLIKSGGSVDAVVGFRGHGQVIIEQVN